jgi:predicted DNA-binding protein (UPF0251 family)
MALLVMIVYTNKCIYKPTTFSHELFLSKNKKKKEVEVEVLQPFSASDLELDELDRKILKTLVDFPELTQEQIAIALGISKSNVYQRLTKPAFKRARADMVKDFIDLLKDAQSAAVRRLRSLVQDQDKNIALAAIRLAMAPYINSGVLSIKTQSTVVHSVRFGDGGQLIRETRDEPDEAD